MNKCPACGHLRQRRHRNTPQAEAYWYCWFCTALAKRVEEYRKLTEESLATRRLAILRSMKVGLKAIEIVKEERSRAD